MKLPLFLASTIVAALFFIANPQVAMAADAPKIAFSTKFGGVDFLFTEEVDRHAQADGSNFQSAIREVGFELISGVGNAAKATPGVQALLIDRIKFKESKSLVVLGLIADGKFLSLNFNGKPQSTALEKFMSGLEQNHVTSLRSADTAGVELFISSK
ncbi:MAG TPA: hypothetical protein VIF82_05770 [Burkholderiaceae bacterium]